MAPLATSPRYSPHQRQRAKAGLPPDGTHKCRPLILVAPRKEGMPQTRRIDSSPPTLAGAAGEAGNAPSAQPPVASFGGGCWECPKWTSTGCCFWRQGRPRRTSTGRLLWKRLQPRGRGNAPGRAHRVGIRGHLIGSDQMQVASRLLPWNFPGRPDQARVSIQSPLLSHLHRLGGLRRTPLLEALHEIQQSQPALLRLPHPEAFRSVHVAPSPPLCKQHSSLSQPDANVTAHSNGLLAESPCIANLLSSGHT